jgi:hypothetical protein
MERRVRVGRSEHGSVRDRSGVTIRKNASRVALLLTYLIDVSNMLLIREW